jgi:putative ABC transport system ATP-binding protein
MTGSLGLDQVSVAFKDAAGLYFSALATGDVHFKPGQITVVSGPSGSGKSTLLHVIAGLIPLKSGVVTWDTKTVSTLSEVQRDRWRLENIGYLFQDFQLIPDMTPFANVALPLSFGRHSVPENRVNQLLNDFGVPASRSRTSELSRGEQQRVAFARALLFDPPIILADEPTASLDRANAVLVIERLKSLASGGKIVIVASHDVDLIAAGHVILHLDHGVVREVQQA